MRVEFLDLTRLITNILRQSLGQRDELDLQEDPQLNRLSKLQDTKSGAKA